MSCFMQQSRCTTNRVFISRTEREPRWYVWRRKRERERLSNGPVIELSCFRHRCCWSKQAGGVGGSLQRPRGKTRLRWPDWIRPRSRLNARLFISPLPSRPGTSFDRRRLSATLADLDSISRQKKTRGGSASAPIEMLSNWLLYE